MKRILISTAGGEGAESRDKNAEIGRTIFDMINSLNREEPTVELEMVQTREEAIAKLQGQDFFHILICMSSTEIAWAKETRARFPGTSFIVLTGWVPKGEITILQKPVTLETICHVAQRW